MGYGWGWVGTDYMRAGGCGLDGERQHSCQIYSQVYKTWQLHGEQTNACITSVMHIFLPIYIWDSAESCLFKWNIKRNLDLYTQVESILIAELLSVMGLIYIKYR